MGTKVAQDEQVRAQLDLVDRAGMLALPVRLDLVEQAAVWFHFQELDRELEQVSA